MRLWGWQLFESPFLDGTNDCMTCDYASGSIVLYHVGWTEPDSPVSNCRFGILDQNARTDAKVSSGMLKRRIKRRPIIFSMLLFWLLLAAAFVGSFWGGISYCTDKVYVAALRGELLSIYGDTAWEMSYQFPSLRGIHQSRSPVFMETHQSIWGQVIEAFGIPGGQGEDCYLIPLGWPVVFSGILVCILFFRPMEYRGRNRCSQCGYDLTGNSSGRCPECGANVLNSIASFDRTF